MVEPFNRHHFLNHKSAIVELLQEIEFVDEQKSIRITRDIESEISAYKDFSFFNFSDNRLVGILFAKPISDFPEIGKTVQLKYLAVRQDFHHKGIANELMDFLISLVKFSFANVILSCYEKNQQAIKFYSKYSFVPYRVNKIIQTRILDQGTDQEHIDFYFIKRMPLKDVTIRPLRTSNIEFLKEMVFQSLYSEGELFDREILKKKDIAKYYEGWDSKKEIGFIARYNDKDIGAIWCRLFPFYNQGYGYVDDHIPEMGIAVFNEYRARGLGQLLMDNLFHRLKQQGIRSVSLSVHTDNPAKRAYVRNGFVAVRREGHSIVMVKKLD